jgi:Tfp pilus assembly protein PilF
MAAIKDVERIKRLHCLMHEAFSRLRTTVLILVISGLVACASQPDQSRIVRGENSEGNGASAGGYDVPSASERYQTRSVTVPPAVTALLEEAELAISNDHYARAESQLAKAQRLAPTVSKTYMLWGHLYKAKGSAIHAEQMYKRALSLATDENQTSLAEAALEALLTE